MPAVYLKGIHGIGVDFLEAWWVNCAWVAQVPLATVDTMETHPAGLAVERPLAASVGKPKVVDRFGPHRHCTPFLQRLEAQNLPLCCDLWRGENPQSSLAGDPAFFPAVSQMDRRQFHPFLWQG